MSSPFRPSVTPTIRRTIDSPVGPLTLMGTGTILTHLLFANQIERAGQVEQARRHGDGPTEDPKGLAECVAQLTEYFGGERTTFAIELAPSGTPFQLEVWQALTTIPYGETCSYGELAARIGRPGAARAVGAANGQNPISIVVPCHRIIGASGDLTGYGGGLDRKTLLLDLEHEHIEPRLPLGVV